MTSIDQNFEKRLRRSSNTKESCSVVGCPKRKQHATKHCMQSASLLTVCQKLADGFKDYPTIPLSTVRIDGPYQEHVTPGLAET